MNKRNPTARETKIYRLLKLIDRVEPNTHDQIKLKLLGGMINLIGEDRKGRGPYEYKAIVSMGGRRWLRYFKERCGDYFNEEDNYDYWNK